MEALWGGDRYFTGGDAVELKLPYIQGAADITLYRTARTGDFSYDIPVRPGNYELRLHFVETIFGPGTFASRGESSRVFSVFLNGQPLLVDFDVLSEAGGAFRAFTRVFKGVSPGSDGMVHLKFVREFDQPIVNAIELVPETGGRMNPVRIVMQANSYVDHAGGVWSADSMPSEEFSIRTKELRWTLATRICSMVSGSGTSLIRFPWLQAAIQLRCILRRDFSARLPLRPRMALAASSTSTQMVKRCCAISTFWGELGDPTSR